MTSPIPPSKEQVEAAKAALARSLSCSWGPYAFPYEPISTILSALDKAELDTARLDWMAAHPTFIAPTDNGWLYTPIELFEADDWKWAETLREAIDAARAVHPIPDSSATA